MEPLSWHILQWADPPGGPVCVAQHGLGLWGKDGTRCVRPGRHWKLGRDRPDLPLAYWSLSPRQHRRMLAGDAILTVISRARMRRQFRFGARTVPACGKVRSAHRADMKMPRWLWLHPRIRYFLGVGVDGRLARIAGKAPSRIPWCEPMR
jgi:hypothetical protein